MASVGIYVRFLGCKYLWKGNLHHPNGLSLGFSPKNWWKWRAAKIKLGGGGGFKDFLKIGGRIGRITRWWQLKYFWNFHSYWGKMNPIWPIDIFQMGWFNHQPVKIPFPSSVHLLFTNGHDFQVKQRVELEGWNGLLPKVVRVSRCVVFVGPLKKGAAKLSGEFQWNSMVKFHNFALLSFSKSRLVKHADEDTLIPILSPHHPGDGKFST